MVNRRCHCWCGLFTTSTPYQLLAHEARRRSRQHQRSSLDGRSRFVRFREPRGEGAGHTRLLHFALKSWLFGFAFRCFEAPPNRWNHSCCGWRKSVVPALRWRQALHGRTGQAFLQSTGMARGASMAIGDRGIFAKCFLNTAGVMATVPSSASLPSSFRQPW